MPSFPQSPLDLQCDLNLGGTWTSVTSYAYQRDGTQPPVTVTRGRPDESAQANPAACAWQWNNRSGRFSPGNPAGPYYGLLGRNTPVRWSVPAQQSYLRLENSNGDRATAADNATLDITGSLEVRWYGRLTDWQAGILAAKWDSGNCWEWRYENVGTLRFGWTDGSSVFHVVSSTAVVPFTSGDFALRVTLDATTGNVTFYTAASIDGTYTQLGAVMAATGGAATSILTAASPLTVGYSADLGFQAYGRVYEMRVYNGIGGTLAADALFSGQAAGTTSWTDAQGNAWSLAGGAEISSRDYRFHGEMSSLPPKWDVTGNDQWVAAQAGGPLRRLSQGTSNVMSAMHRAVTTLSGSFRPVAYWTMEDAAGATQFGAAIGANPMTFTTPKPALASDSSFIASAPLPALGSSVISANVPSYTGGTAWAVRFGFKRGTPPGSQARLLTVSTTGACSLLEVLVDTIGTLSLSGWNAAGTQVVNIALIAYPELPGPAWWSLEATQVGGNVLYALVAVAPGAGNGDSASSSVAGVFGNVTSVQLNSDGTLTDSIVGHLYVQSAWESLFVLGAPLNAWQGEAAAARYARLAGENGYQARILGYPSGSAAMGAQTAATLGALLQECETADMGQQFEPRQQLALGYRTLASMLNQSPALTLDYSQGQLGGVNGSADDGGLDPVYDDQLIANDWTLTRSTSSGAQGATVQYQLADGSAMSISAPPAGAGDYAKTGTLNVQLDSQLPDAAGWLVHLGTVNEARWPAVPMNLARPEIQGTGGEILDTSGSPILDTSGSPILDTASGSLYWAALQVEAGDYIELLALPDVITYDPVKQLALGFAEAPGGFHYTTQWSAVPESPYETAVYDDLVYGRADTDGSSLAAGVTSSAVTLSVSTTGPSGILWTTSAADFPFDIAVGGERMTVTNITGSSSPQSFTVTRSVNGVIKAQSSGADVRLWFPPVYAIA